MQSRILIIINSTRICLKTFVQTIILIIILRLFNMILLTVKLVWTYGLFNLISLINCRYIFDYFKSIYINAYLFVYISINCQYNTWYRSRCDIDVTYDKWFQRRMYFNLFWQLKRYWCNKIIYLFFILTAVIQYYVVKLFIYVYI